MNHDSPARLHIPRIRFHIDYPVLIFWGVYIGGILYVAKLILNAIP